MTDYVLIPGADYKAICDAVRRKSGKTELLKSGVIPAEIDALGGELAKDATNVAFGPDQIDPDEMYKIGYNWFARLVEIAHEMAGSSKNLTPEEIIGELRRVIYIPQGRASSDVPSTVSSVYSSKSGFKPVTSITRATARTNSHKKGDKWWMMDYAVWSAIQILYLVEYADWDSQNVLGTGQDSGALVASGGTDEAVYHSLKRSGASNQYRWIEDPWSNCYDFVDGIVVSDYRVYLNNVNANNGDTTTNHTNTGKSIPSGGYISRYHDAGDFDWAFLPREAGGAEATYVTDYVQGNNGVRVAYVGGSYSASAYSGLFYLYYSSNASFSNSNLGARLLFIP